MGVAVGSRGTKVSVCPGMVDGMLPRIGRRWGEAERANAQASRGGSLRGAGVRQGRVCAYVCVCVRVCVCVCVHV